MDDAVATKKTKDRSPNFPFIPLETAIERARQFYAEEKRGAAPFTRAVLHWNYSPSSSGAIQTVAALKTYGLMVDAGGTGPARTVQLTDLALRILLDQRLDSHERAAHIRTSALMPPLASEFYKKWEDGIPRDATINHTLVLDKKFNEETALKVLKILKKNHSFANVGGAESDSSGEKIDNEIENTSETPDPMQVQNSATEQIKMQPSSAANTAVFTEQVFLGDETVTLQFKSKPQQATYEMLKSFLEWKMMSVYKVNPNSVQSKQATKDDEGPIKDAE